MLENQSKGTMGLAAEGGRREPGGHRSRCGRRGGRKPARAIAAAEDPATGMQQLRDDPPASPLTHGQAPGATSSPSP